MVEKKNRNLEEMDRIILCKNALPKYFWAEVVNTASYVLNKILVKRHLKKTLYELWKGRKLNISYFHVFSYKCFILNNNNDNLEKFDAKADEGIFLGYSMHNKAFRVFNKITLVVEEFIHDRNVEAGNSSVPRALLLCSALLPAYLH